MSNERLVSSICAKLAAGGYGEFLPKNETRPPAKTTMAELLSDDVVKAYVRGDKLEAIRAEFKLTSDHIYDVLRCRGVPLRSKTTKAKAIADDYANGDKIEDIMRRYNVSRGQVRYARVKFGSVRPSAKG